MGAAVTGMGDPGRPDGPLRPWRTVARNLPEHGDNAIHTDAGARAAGFERALVAGTTVYAYLSHPVSAGLGDAWLHHGGAEVRFSSPVFADDVVDLVVDGLTVVAEVEGRPKAELVALPSPPPPGPPSGERLAPLTFDLDDSLVGYGRRAGDDLDLFDDPDLVHPVVWPIIGNRTTIATCVDGPWVHVRSRIGHHRPVRPGDSLVVEPWLTRRFGSRAGERVVLDLAVTCGARLVATIEHESIVELA